MGLVAELVSCGLRVSDERHPFKELEPGRIKQVAKNLTGAWRGNLPDALGVTGATLSNWSNNPGSVAYLKAEQLVRALVDASCSRFGIRDEVDRQQVRGAVLQELTEKPAKRDSDVVRMEAMDALIASSPEYLLSDELEHVCFLVACAVATKRRGQMASGAASAYLSLAEAWCSQDDGRDGRIAEALDAYNAATRQSGGDERH